MTAAAHGDPVTSVVIRFIAARKCLGELHGGATQPLVHDFETASVEDCGPDQVVAGHQGSGREEIRCAIYFFGNSGNIANTRRYRRGAGRSGRGHGRWILQAA